MAVMALWSGREARALRMALRMSVEAFAEHLGVGVRTVAHWDAQGPEIVPMPAMQDVLDTALEQATPAQQLRFQLLIGGPAAGTGSGGRPDEQALTDRPDPSREQEQWILEAARRPERDDDVNRRQMLAKLGMLGIVTSLVGVESVRRGLAAGLLGDEHTANVDEWDQIADEYARAYLVTPADRLLEDLTADLSVLEQGLRLRGLGTSDDATKRSLALVAGQLATISALAWAGAGEARQAHRWMRTARGLADRSGDAGVRAWVRGVGFTSLPCSERSVTAIVDQAEEAVSIAGHRACIGTAELHAGLAQSFAMAGRGEEALSALERAVDVIDRLPAQVVANEDSLLGCPEVCLHHTESYVYTWLGDTTRAYAAQDTALRLYPESHIRSRAKMLLHRAGCMIQDGDVGGGLEYAAQVVDDLPAMHRTESVRAIGRAVMNFVPAQERRRPEVAALRERLEPV